MNASVRSILFHNGFVHSASDPFATAVFIEDGVVAWLGEELSSSSFKKRADLVVDLGGALVAPAFVDTHVHILETGLSSRSIDVSPSGGGTSAESVLGLLRSAISDAPQGVLEATGLSDAGWIGPSITSADLDATFPNLEVYVPNADLHSAVCSSVLLARSGATVSASDNGRVVGAEHLRVRDYIRSVTSPIREALYSETLKRAAQLGLVSLHENSAPGIDSVSGLNQLTQMTQKADSGFPLVVGYRGELIKTTDDLVALKQQVPLLRGAAGDLNIDGSFGSHSAAVREHYADLDGAFGDLYLSAEEIAVHLRTCSEANVPAGFHIIGDAALDRLLEAAQIVANEPGMLPKMRRSGHRLEHVELADDASISELARLGFMVSVQPAFDSKWGGTASLYSVRLGSERALATNPIAQFLKAGVPVGFGSDAPVTDLDPWGTIAAAVFHKNESSRISARAAFKAHTRGGWRLGGEQNPLAGEIRIGAPAHVAIWQADEFGVQAENGNRSSWSTDARSGSPLLPILDQRQVHAGVRPRCLATLRDGRFIFSTYS